LVGAALALTTFYGCQKEISAISEQVKLDEVQDAQAYYNGLSSASGLTQRDALPIPNRRLLWQLAKVQNLRGVGQAVVTVPLKRGFENTPSYRYAVFFKKNNLQKMVYVSIVPNLDDYARKQNKNQTLDLNNLTGDYFVHDNSFMPIGGFRVENGKVQNYLKPKIKLTQRDGEEVAWSNTLPEFEITATQTGGQNAPNWSGIPQFLWQDGGGGPDLYETPYLPLIQPTGVDCQTCADAMPRYPCIAATSVALSDITNVQINGGIRQVRTGNFIETIAITRNGDVRLGGITITANSTAAGVFLTNGNYNQLQNMIATAYSTASANYSCTNCIDVTSWTPGNTNPIAAAKFAGLWVTAFNALSSNTWGSNTTTALGTIPNVTLTIGTNNSYPGAAGALRPCQ
jgi:hypothetical protein